MEAHVYIVVVMITLGSYIRYFTLYMYVGIGGQTVTIVTDPAGVPVDGQNNTFDYPILTNVTLMCIATAADELPATVTSYYWNATNCYNNSDGVLNPCHRVNGLTRQNITGNNLRAQHTGIVSCTATINGTNYTSDPLTVRISGELDIYIHF